jgi:hypothetical protein
VSQQSSPRPSSSRPRSGSRAVSPSRRRKRDQDAADKGASIGKGPDPSEFDPEFVIGDEEVPSGVGTPAVAVSDTDGTTMSTKENGPEPGEKKEEGTEGATDGAPASPAILPVDVRQKLRKLERLEPKYSGNFGQLNYDLFIVLICAQIYSGRIESPMPESLLSNHSKLPFARIPP